MSLILFIVGISLILVLFRLLLLIAWEIRKIGQGLAGLKVEIMELRKDIRSGQ